MSAKQQLKKEIREAYLFLREKNNTIISFEGGDNTIREARPLHLRGKKIVVATSDEDNNIKVDMSKIFV